MSKLNVKATLHVQYVAAAGQQIYPWKATSTMTPTQDPSTKNTGTSPEKITHNLWK